MRILLITTFYPPEGKAGTEIYTATLARELQRQGHDVQVVCATGWDQGDRYWNGVQEESVDGVRVCRLALNWQKARRPNDYLFDNPETASFLQQFIQHHRPEAAHIVSCLTLSASVIPVIKAASLPVVLTLMDFWFICPRHTLLRCDDTLCDGRTTHAQCVRCMVGDAKIYRWPRRLFPESTTTRFLDVLSRVSWLTGIRGMRGQMLDVRRRRQVLFNALRQCDIVVSHSHFLKEVVEQAGVDVPILVLPNGHDLTWQRATPSARRDRQGIRFGTLSHLAPIKGIHLAIDAIGMLPAEAKAELLVFGGIDRESPYGQKIVQDAATNSRIQLRGVYRHEELEQVFSELDAVLVPSQWYENAPLVIQEAFAARKPVIASNLGGMAEAVRHGVNGLLFRPGDAVDLSRQMLALIQDPALLTKLGEGIAPVRTVESEVAGLIALYNGLVK
jgi:glycosyltransferase involved in cell wall biosynthesis